MKLKKFFKPLAISCLSATLLVILLIGLGVYNNNIDTAQPSRETLNSALDKATSWLHQNKSAIMANHNPALWWMLKEASLISDNEKLKTTYKNYKYSYLDLVPNNVWTPYFDEHYTPPLPDISFLIKLHDYQLFFIYALSCNTALKEDPIIQKQFDPDFCSNHFLHPRCVTHQQMAVRFLNKKQCGDHKDLANALLETITQEITYDFRVTDSYIQRALMLTDSDRPLKPVWISKILKAQMKDGGWADFYPIIELGNTRIGTTSTRPSKAPKASDFHATAQAIWLIAMLLDDTRDQ